MSKNILKLFEYKASIFNYDDFASIFKDLNRDYLKIKINNLCKEQILVKLTKWIYYLKNKWYDSFELVAKIYSPSYISFHSALYHHSMIFQLPEWTSFAYLRNIEKYIQYDFIYSKRLKEEILYNTNWIISNWLFSIASRERAFLDTLYIYWDIYIDNLSSLDKNKVLQMLDIYKNKKFEERVKLYLNKI